MYIVLTSNYFNVRRINTCVNYFVRQCYKKKKKMKRNNSLKNFLYYTVDNTILKKYRYSKCHNYLRSRLHNVRLIEKKNCFFLWLNKFIKIDRPGELGSTYVSFRSCASARLNFMPTYLYNLYKIKAGRK